MDTYTAPAVIATDSCTQGADALRDLTVDFATITTALTKVGQNQPCSTDVIKRGQAALERVERGHWPDWRDIIKALAAGRAAALDEAGAATPQGPEYRAAMGRWLRRHGFDSIDKSDRVRLLQCADHLAAIDAWRDKLEPDQQVRLNHPRTVWMHWNKSPHPDRGASNIPTISARDDIGSNSSGEIARKLARLDELEAETARLKRENLALKNEVEELNAGVSAQLSLSKLGKAFECLAPSDQKVLVDKVLRAHPDFLQQVLRQRRRLEEITDDKIARLARKITAFAHHPAQHIEEIRKTAAEILHLVEPESATKNGKLSAAPPTGNLSAWKQAMSSPKPDVPKTTAEAIQ